MDTLYRNQSIHPTKNPPDLVLICEKQSAYGLILHPMRKPKSDSSMLRRGYTLRTSNALGSVVRSGIVIELFKPHMEESTTNRGDRESLSASPGLPTASFSPNSAWAAAILPGYL